jgi:dinuclear metal center YbgI/SA1388 family protein
MRRDELVRYLDDLLEAPRFKDYCPNGLQVEGRAELRRVVAGVSASRELLDAAVARGADAVLVHHGYFWRGEDARVVGMRRRRLATLLANDMNLIAYHLPLDAHPEFGNNAGLAAACGWCVEGRFLEQEVGFFGSPLATSTLGEVARRIARALEREPLVIGDAMRPLRRIAWCSGGAQSGIEQAVELGVDAYVSGEVSEQTVHVARECGIAYIAAGHHATERFGVAALARHLADRFGIAAEFVDIDNPA